MTVPLILYSTAGCHLCEQAEALLGGAGLRAGRDYRLQDIALDASLVERYGIRIPVLQRASAELDWPFDAQGLRRFLDGGGAG